MPDNGLGSRADNQLFFQFRGFINHHSTFRVTFQPVMGNNGTFFGKAFYMICFFTQKRLGNKQGEIGILMPGILEHLVQSRLHFLPNGIAIGLNYHTATHGRILSKIGLNYNVIIPLRKVVFSSGKISGHNFLAWCLCRLNRSYKKQGFIRTKILSANKFSK